MCTLPVVPQSLCIQNRSLAALLYACCYLLLYLPAEANLYIVLSQDVVTVAVVLEVTLHVLAATSKNIIYVACYFHRGISTYVLIIKVHITSLLPTQVSTLFWTLHLLLQEISLPLGWKLTAICCMITFTPPSYY